jgi:hypothetical protein
VTREVRNSHLLASTNDQIEITHILKPYYRRSGHYLFVIRHPVSRAMSAFNWRRHLVVETEKQRDRFSGKWNILQR